MMGDGIYRLTSYNGRFEYIIESIIYTCDIHILIYIKFVCEEADS